MNADIQLELDNHAINSMILQSISDQNMIFISAQPDETYFHWQVHVYMYQFAKHGISDRCYAIFGYQGAGPSAQIIALKKQYPGIRYYPDKRTDRTYAPSIRPYVLAKFFTENPTLGKNVFYHDSDILLVKLPRFDLMLEENDRVIYLSDTVSYIGYNYIYACSQRYKMQYKDLHDADIFNGMCDIIGINYQMVINNNDCSGGAQYLLKDIDSFFWIECLNKCNQIYKYLSDYEKKYPIKNHIQKWTTDMWVLLWVLWKYGMKTEIHKELDFSWATHSMKDFNNKNIFHLAGITESNCKDKFYKGLYARKNLFAAYETDSHIFDHIDPQNATYGYIEIVKEYMDSIYFPKKNNNQIYRKIISTKLEKKTTSNNMNQSDTIPSSDVIDLPDTIKLNKQKKDLNKTKFTVIASREYAGKYVIDMKVFCCEKNIWKSVNKKYIIYWNSFNWILTHTYYINQIGINTGGIMTMRGNQPYDETWIICQ